MSKILDVVRSLFGASQQTMLLISSLVVLYKLTSYELLSIFLMDSHSLGFVPLFLSGLLFNYYYTDRSVLIT